MRYKIHRQNWNENTYNGYTDNPYWYINIDERKYGLKDNGELWSIDNKDILHKNMIKTIIKECNLSIKLK